MQYQEGTIQKGYKDVYDFYNKKIHIGALVAYNKSGEVRIGEVTDVMIKDVFYLGPTGRNSYIEVSAVIKIKEKDTNNVSKVKNIASVLVI